MSGGEEGALNGPSIMPGGSAESYEKLGPIFESIAAQVDGTPCCVHVGPDGAGHFVKMVHNGIEYADMQLIAEAYDLLRHGLGASAGRDRRDLPRRGTRATSSRSSSRSPRTCWRTSTPATGKAFVDIVLDQAEQKGTGRWTVQSALDLGVPITGIAEATFARALSGHAEQRAAGAGGVRLGRSARSTSPTATRSSRTSGCALYASKVVAYAQGFDHIAAGSARVRLGHRPRRDGDDLARRLHHPGPVPRPDPRGLRRRPATCRRCWSRRTSPTRSRNGVDAWRRVVSGAALAGIPTPAFSSSLAYYDGLRRDRLPAALIQGLRDNFGAHTYRRVDRDGTFHTEWAGDKKEHDA